MQQRDFDCFVDIIQAVSEQYGKRLSDSVLALYWQGLQDFELIAVRDALGRHLRNTDTGQFMPKIADIIKMLQGSSLDSALNAWAKIDQALRQVGPYETVVFDDPLIHRVLHDMGGWMMLGQKTDDEWPFVAREFEQRYRGFKSRNERFEYPAKLIGVSEAHNSKEGHKTAQPMLIGDATQAKAVMLAGANGGKLLGLTRMYEVIDNVAMVEHKEQA